MRGAREDELRWRVRANIVDVIITFVWTWMPAATALAVFVSYTIFAGHPLTVAVAFTATALFSYLQGPMLQLPGQIFAMLNGAWIAPRALSCGAHVCRVLCAAWVSMQRIQKFLAEPEVPDWASSLKRDPHDAAASETEIGFEHASFEWDIAPDDQPARFTLGPLDLRFPAGKLSLVSGPTGSGKSALLVALLGGACALTPSLCLVFTGLCVPRDALHVRPRRAQQGGAPRRVLRAEPVARARDDPGQHRLRRGVRLRRGALPRGRRRVRARARL